MTKYEKGMVKPIDTFPSAWFVYFSHLCGGDEELPCVMYREPDTFSTRSLAMNEYREHDRKVRESIMTRPPAAAAAVLTVSGLIVKGDTEHRPGDPIIGPDSRVHYVERVLRPTEVVAAPAGLAPELPLFFD